MTLTIGERIKNLRKLAGLSQEELGRRVGLQRAAINKYEVGSVTNIPIQTIEKLANVFDVSPVHILGWYDTDLALETKVLHDVSMIYGKDAVDVLESYTHLTDRGKSKLAEYAGELEQLYHD